jgi:ATP-dependent DNA helicase RecQ
MGERERVLLSIAERAGAVELEPGARGGLQVRLTGRGDPRKAYAAIKAAKDRGWESYRAIERFISNGERCRRRQILDHFGDEEAGAPSGRCCDVCEADAELAAAARGAGKPARRAAPPSDARDAPEAAPREPVDEAQFDTLRAWRMGRAEGKPAFTVASNAVLEALLRERPSSREGLLGIRGIGPAFCEKHGESLLEALAELTAPRTLR